MLIHWENAAGARLAHPREDHLVPLMVVAGAAQEDSGRHVSMDRAFKVTMASYEFGGR
jgi:aromatic ring-opening dioxygenase catalytic subunit (LigB family)